MLWMVGWRLAYLAGETTAGTSLIERGQALDPNCAQAWLASAYVNCFACHNDAAIQALEHVARLSPLDPLGHLVKFAFAFALAKIQKPGFLNAMVVRTAACGHLDLREEEGEWVGRIREIASQRHASARSVRFDEVRVGSKRTSR
jgi:hypothetical protein